MAYARATCATCGQENVPHRKDGGPLWAHTLSTRHVLAVYNARKAAREAASARLAAEPVTAWCPHGPCSQAFRESEIKDGKTPYHDYPKPTRQLCNGSKLLPLREDPAVAP